MYVVDEFNEIMQKNTYLILMVTFQHWIMTNRGQSFQDLKGITSIPTSLSVG